MIVEHRTYTSSYFIPSSLRSHDSLSLFPLFMLKYVDLHVSLYQQPPNVEKV